MAKDQWHQRSTLGDSCKYAHNYGLQMSRPGHCGPGFPSAAT